MCGWQSLPAAAFAFVVCMHPAQSMRLPCTWFPTRLRADSWGWDPFQLSEVTGGKPLSALSYWLLKRHHGECLKACHVDEVRLCRFLVRVEEGEWVGPLLRALHTPDMSPPRPLDHPACCIECTSLCGRCYGGGVPSSGRRVERLQADRGCSPCQTLICAKRLGCVVC